jgi:hypothetical protein
LPPAVVVGEVGVGELALEPRLPVTPVEVEVLRQERGGDHPRAVVHPVRRRELSHRGVYERKTGAPFLPGREAFAVLAPGETVELATEISFHHAREVRQDVVEEVAPRELREEARDAGLRAGWGVRSGRSHGGEDHARRDRAEVEVRRKPRGPLPGGEVPVAGIVGEAFAHKAVEPRPRRVLAAGRGRRIGGKVSPRQHTGERHARDCGCREAGGPRHGRSLRRRGPPFEKRRVRRVGRTGIGGDLVRRHDKLVGKEPERRARGLDSGGRLAVAPLGYGPISWLA